MTQPIVRRIAARCEERVLALGLKGKARDNAALHYMIGAAEVAVTRYERVINKLVGTAS